MIKRELYINKITKLIDKDEIKVITGVRRSGKTYLLKLIQEELLKKGVNKENIFFISFESYKFFEISNYQELSELVMNLTENIEGRVYLLFDEIQSVENWQKSVNAFRVDLDADIYITGSNSKLLSGEFATLLTGRYISMNIFPFSFREFIQYKIKYDELDLDLDSFNLKSNKASFNQEIYELFEEYLNYGGFPGLLKYEKSEQKDYLEDIYNSIILRDILERAKINDINLLKRLIRYIISTTGQTFSSVSIYKYLKNEGIKTSPSTILNFMEHIVNSHLIYKVQREDLKGKNILKSLEKYYVVDPSFYRMFVDEENRDKGSLLENIVLIELLRRGYDVTIGKVGNLEVDFVCRKYGKIFYLQVSETLKGLETRNREKKPLEKIKDNYPKYIITTDNIESNVGSFIHMHIIDFLLSSHDVF